jgi:SAM-dependent methyltransferase
MFTEEAQWLKTALQDLDLPAGATVLNIGSSTESFRCLGQPFIDYYVFRPLEKRGIQTLHVDVRQDEGVDIVCDLTDPANEALVEKLPQADVVLCSNMLEHVRDRGIVVRRLQQLTKPGGHLIITVPHVYKYHEDPIDTMYRPTNKQLEALYSRKEFAVVRSAILRVQCGYFDAPWNIRKDIYLRTSTFIRRRFLKHPIKKDFCRVAVVVLRKTANV